MYLATRMWYINLSKEKRSLLFCGGDDGRLVRLATGHGNVPQILLRHKATCAGRGSFLLGDMSRSRQVRP